MNLQLGKAIENIKCRRTIFTGEKGKWLFGHNKRMEVLASILLQYN